MDWKNYYKVQLLLTIITIILLFTLTIIPMLISIVKIWEVLMILGMMLIFNQVVAFGTVYIPKGYKWLKNKLL